MLDLSPSSLDTLLNAMATNRNYAQMYFEYKIKAGDPFMRKGCDNTCLRHHLCEIPTNEIGDTRRCKELMKNNNF
jgi:hypothetical protein